MKNVMGIIHHVKNEGNLKEITRQRCLAAVPFGGRYRLVDFALSNMVNAGMRNIGIVTSINMRSLLDHLGSGREWGLDKKQEGLFILPAAHAGESKNARKVDLEDMHVNLDYLKRSRQKFVVVSGSNMVCNIDFKRIFLFHQEMQSDLTLVYKEDYPFGGDDLEGNVFLETGPGGRVLAVRGRPAVKKRHRVSMDIYLLSKELLVQIVEHCAAAGKWDLVKDIIAGSIKELRVYGYEHRGYLAIINSLGGYLRRHLELLNPEIWQELFFRHGTIYTKLKDGPPTKYFENSEVRNTLVANGCKIEGKVENSILYRGVRIARGAVVKNSVVMPKAEIEEEAVLDGVILDKNVRVRKGARLLGDQNRPLVVPKNALV
ncbi:MAG: glucose-1-phosphate adenylyltransferase subunit GlgD [Peptococcaceae bacterium]|jgi:glucose-1-phosphate adenylyltransferase|nr:glucose-1-phosphate adenylyltransferase subunit GlgD [Peptococcaceae bacterium]MDH7524695.1 glucose-1-phosphate adenylyltransferase subunit GlgD [Peptococcaceae bacterium]